MACKRYRARSRPSTFVTVAAVQHDVRDPGVPLVLVLRKPPALVEDEAHAGEGQRVHRQRLELAMVFEVRDQIVCVPCPLGTGTQLLEPSVDEQPLQRVVEVLQ